MVQLAGDEGAWKRDAREVIPQRIHGAGAHPAQRAGKAGDVVRHPLGAHLGHERGPATLEAREQGQRAPVVDERLQPVLLDALGEPFVPAPASLSGLFLEARVRTDGEQREDSFRSARGGVERQAAAHRITHEVRARDSEMVPEPLEVVGASVHAARRAGPGTRLAMSAQVGHDPHPAFRHPGNDLEPAATVLREPVEQGDRRAGAEHEVAQSHVRTVENHSH